MVSCSIFEAAPTAATIAPSFYIIILSSLPFHSFRLLALLFFNSRAQRHSAYSACQNEAVQPQRVLHCLPGAVCMQCSGVPGLDRCERAVGAVFAAPQLQQISVTGFPRVQSTSDQLDTLNIYATAAGIGVTAASLISQSVGLKLLLLLVCCSRSQAPQWPLWPGFCS
jgi:hypothetical protein